MRGTVSKRIRKYCRKHSTKESGYKYENWAIRCTGFREDHLNEKKAYKRREGQWK